MIDHLPAETVAFQLIVAGVKDDVFCVRVHQQVAMRGANGAVAEGHFELLKRRNFDCIRDSAAVAFGVVRDLFGLLSAGRHE